MLPELSSLFDPAALAVVLIGTAIATLVRSGPKSCCEAMREAAGVFGNDFDKQKNRIALAKWVSAIKARGPLGADETLPPDPALANALRALVRNGAIEAMDVSLASSRAQSLAQSERASNLFEQAGELAPVFGLVGTLFAMTQIASAGETTAATVSFEAVATAVLSSLYGVLAAHLVLLPLADAITRKLHKELDAREKLFMWLVSEIDGATAPRPASLKSAA